MRGCPMAAANSLGPIFVLFLSNQYRWLGAALSPSLNYSFFFFCLPTFDGAYILPTAFFAPFDFVHRRSISHWAHSWPLYYHHFEPPSQLIHPLILKGIVKGQPTNQKNHLPPFPFIHSLWMSWHIYASTHIWPPAAPSSPIPHSITSAPSYSPIQPFNLPSSSTLRGLSPFFRAQTLFFPRPFFLHAPFSSLLRRPFEWAAKCHQLMWAKCGSIWEWFCNFFQNSQTYNKIGSPNAILHFMAISFFFLPSETEQKQSQKTPIISYFFFTTKPPIFLGFIFTQPILHFCWVSDKKFMRWPNIFFLFSFYFQPPNSPSE